MNLIKKIKQAKKLNKNAAKKEEELSCFKRLSIVEIPLSQGLHPDRLQKTLTDRFSSEMDRLYARILSSPIIQRTLVKMKEAKGLELTEKFLQRNEKKVKQTVSKRIDQEVKDKIEKSTADKKIQQKESKSKDETTKKEPKSKDKAVKPGAFVRNPNFNGSISSDESEAEDVDQVPKSEDPFFLSTTGSNYLTTVTTTVSESSGDDDEEEPPKKQFKRKAGKVQKFNNGHRKENGNQHKFEPKVNRQKPTERTQKLNEKPPKAASSIEPDIHPSWAAKQQQKKLQIQEFKGTKIKFDD